MNRFRLPAVLCSVLFLAAELISRPFAEMGLCDDWSYIRTSQLLAQTGHLTYNAWATAMIGWQLFAAAAFIKLFGFSFTAARMSTLVVATLTVFFIQRIFVRAGISERNASIGALALALTPLYMQLSVSFMTDIQGLFAIVLCLYGCIRALQTRLESHATAWILFAVVANAIVGSSRQIAWLGILVIVPCALWLLRGQRRVVISGAVATVFSVVFIFATLHWFQRQPYSLPEHLLVPVHGLHDIAFMMHELFRAALETPFLLLALLFAFYPEIRRNGARFWVVIALIAVAYTGIAIKLTARHGAGSMLEPVLGDWLGPQAYYDQTGIADKGPVVLGIPARAVLTALATLGTLCILAFTLRKRRGVPRLAPEAQDPQNSTGFTLTYGQLFWLLVPFATAYFCLLIPRSASKLLDRYLLGLAFVLALYLIRAYQDFVNSRLPSITIAAVASIALFSIASTHDMFAFYRARIALAQQVNAAGIAPQNLDGGFEYNGWEALQRSAYVNDPRLINPAGAYHPVPPHRGYSCDGTKDDDGSYFGYDPRVGVAYNPNACAGSTDIPPVTYSRWLGHDATLYAVRYQPGK